MEKSFKFLILITLMILVIAGGCVLAENKDEVKSVWLSNFHDNAFTA
jgi:hypothetical protein